MKKLKLNERINANEVRVIDENGDNIGVKPIREAITIAKSRKLDLLEVSPGANPPVCRIVDYNKYQYEQKSKLKKAKTKKTELKEFQMRPSIDTGDLDIRIARGRKFLSEGNMVKYTVKFKGRENAHTERGETKLKIVESELADVGKIESAPRRFGNMLSMTLVPVGKQKE